VTVLSINDKSAAGTTGAVLFGSHALEAASHK